MGKRVATTSQRPSPGRRHSWTFLRSTRRGLFLSPGSGWLALSFIFRSRCCAVVVGPDVARYAGNAWHYFERLAPTPDLFGLVVSSRASEFFGSGRSTSLILRAMFEMTD